MTRTFTLLPLVFALACNGGGDTDTDPGTDTGSDTGSDTAATCDNNGFTAASEEFTYTSFYDWTVYGAASGSDVPWDGMTIEWRFVDGATPGPQITTFTGENYETCTTCFTVAKGCTTTDTCQKMFLAESGTLNVTSLGNADGTDLKGTLENVKLIEVTIDPTTLHSTPVDGGETWCLDSYAFEGVTL